VKGLKSPYSRGLKEDREQLILKYIPLVKHVLGRLPVVLPSGLDREDLYSVGVCGLIHAADTYDPSKGAIFKTYAYTTVRGAILDELRRHDPVPRSWREKLRDYDQAAALLRERLGREPSFDDLAEAMGIPVKRVEKDMLAMRTAALLSLDDEQGQEGELRQLLEEPTARDPSDEAALREDVDRLAAAIGRLPEQERRVVVLYFHEELLLKEIGTLLGVSESRVSQVLTKAIHHLRRLLKDGGRGA